MPVFELDGSLIMSLINGDEPTNDYVEYEIHIVKTKVKKTLIIDEELLRDLVKFAKGKYKNSKKKTITLSDIKDCDKSILKFYKVDKFEKGGLEGEYVYSMFEGDYKTNPYRWQLKTYSLNELLKEYVEQNKDKVKWEIEENVISDETY